MLLCMHCRRRRVAPQDTDFCQECLMDLEERDAHYWWSVLPSSLDPTEAGAQLTARDDFGAAHGVSASGRRARD